ncbi:MAG: orotate phosphoribosyltransferase [Candidatus Eisenbacteria bacterium]|uniref:Orotate phosphoribosyltransferase n=1 Tax=Eiseniibacteriota bacterium TaxID=2212470 RepID=A0A538TAY8_UNCEI|nr:MAG: orotate phosphoribosyltransferase [Candidatus Eisenbacteria bacterium]
MGLWYPSRVTRATGLPAELEADRARLKEILLERSIRFGDFTLSSGLKSKYYADVRQTSLHPEGAVLIARLLDPILLEYGARAVGGLTLGADPIVGALLTWTEIQGRGLPGFIVRKSEKAYGTARRIEGPFDKKLPAAIVDDVITKGGSALAACEAVREAGGAVCVVACVVDRNEGGAEEFKSRGVPFRSIFQIREFL